VEVLVAACCLSVSCLVFQYCLRTVLWLRCSKASACERGDGEDGALHCRSVEDALVMTATDCQQALLVPSVADQRCDADRKDV